jgi:hypothetical protein
MVRVIAPPGDDDERIDPRQHPYPVTGARHPKRQPLRGHGLAGLILQEHGHHRRLPARVRIALRRVLGSRALRDDPAEDDGPRRVGRAHQAEGHKERGGHHAQGHEHCGPAADPGRAARQHGGHREQERQLDGENHQLPAGHADVAPPAEVAHLVLVACPGLRAGGLTGHVDDREDDLREPGGNPQRGCLGLAGPAEPDAADDQHRNRQQHPGQHAQHGRQVGPG